MAIDLLVTILSNNTFKRHLLIKDNLNKHLYLIDGKGAD